MTSVPAFTSHVKGVTMPTLGNSGIRSNNNNNEHVKHIVYADMGSPANKFVTGTNTIKQSNIAIKPFVPAAKLTVDGKVVDIDVLTKLQQQNGGNIVSFTASKEFLSNLTSAKNNSTKLTGTHKPRINKQDVSVFKSMTGKKSQEKVLLPKNPINGFMQKSKIEVKKFAPEIKGLLSGLSAFKTTSTASVNTTSCSRDVQSGLPFQSQNLSSKMMNDQATRNLLLAVKSTGHVTPSTLSMTNSVGKHMNSMPQITTNNRQPQAPPLKKMSWNCLPSPSSVIVPNSAVRNNSIARTQSVITSAGSNKSLPFNTSYNQFELAPSFKQPNQCFGDETKKRTPPTCNMNIIKDEYQVHTTDYGQRSNTYESQFHYLKNTSEAPKSSQIFRSTTHVSKTDITLPMMNLNEVKPNIFDKANGYPTSTASPANFTELYENAVRNVLNIKAFSESFTDVTNTASYSKQIENAFETYLKRPVEFDIKLEQFQHSGIKRQDSLDSNHLNGGEPSSKTMRAEEKMTNNNMNESRTNSRQTSPEKMNPAYTLPRYNSPHDDGVEYFKLFDFKRREEEEKKMNHYRNQNKIGEVDNRNFFAQFLSDQTFFAQHQPQPYYSPADFPWLYPSYMYEKYYQANLPYYYYGDYRNETVNEKAPTPNYGDYHTEPLSGQFPTSKSPKYEEDNKRNILPQVQEKAEEEQSTTKSEYSNTSEAPFRMKLNTIPITNEQPDLLAEIKQEPVTSPIIHDVRKKTKNKKDVLKRSPIQSRKLKIKECLKYRPYSLRQRVKELKKAEKIAQLKPKQPKYVLKDMNAKNLTKKEMFLAQLGLRRILKRNERRSSEGR